MWSLRSLSRSGYGKEGQRGGRYSVARLIGPLEVSTSTTRNSWSKSSMIRCCRPFLTAIATPPDLSPDLFLWYKLYEKIFIQLSFSLWPFEKNDIWLVKGIGVTKFILSCWPVQCIML